MSQGQLIKILLIIIMISQHVTTKAENQKKIFNQNEKDTLLHQFKKIDTDFNKILKLLNERRIKRDVPRKKPSTECEISIDVLNDLKNIIKDAVNQTKQNTSNKNCEMNFNETNNCNELINTMQCGIIYIENNLIKNNSTFKDFTILKNAYDKLLEKYTKISDELKKSLEQEFKTEINILTNDLNLLKIMLEEKEKELTKYIVEIVGFEISFGNIEKALQEYNKLSNELQLSNLNIIIQTPFQNTFNIKILKYLFDFTKNIPSKCQKCICYFFIIKEMQVNNFINSSTNQEIINEFKNFLKLSEYDDLYNNLNQCSDNAKNIFNNTLKVIINKSIDQYIQSDDNVIYFTDEFFTTEQKIIMYPILFEEMIQRQLLDSVELILLTYRVKELINNKTCFDITELNKLYIKLPNNVKTLLTNKYIFIKNRQYDKYLLDGNHYYSRVCYEDITSQYQKWEVQTYEKGKYFGLINQGNFMAYECCLFKILYHLPVIDNDRHFVEIYPVENASYFYIKNRFFQKVMEVNFDIKYPNCYEVQMEDKYTGNHLQQWIIE